MTATMTKRVLQERDPARVYLNPDIDIQYELTIGNDVLKVGDPILIKGDNKTRYNFRFLAHNIKLDSTWVELCGPTGFRSVRIEKLKFIRIVKKRSRRNKVNEAVVD